MIDLTPLDVRKKKGDFRKKPLGGYDTEEVDNFLDLVEDRLEELVRENLTLTERLSVLKARLDMLEGREKAVQEALVSAQELRAEVQDQSLKDAEVLEEQSRREIQLLKKEAESEIERRFQEAESLLKERQMALEELERNRRKFLKTFRSLLEREMDAVEVEENRRPLEDVPLDLQLRGFYRGEGGSSGDDGEAGDSPHALEPLWLSSLLKQEDSESNPEDNSTESEGGDRGGDEDADGAEGGEDHSEEEDSGEITTEDSDMGGEDGEVEEGVEREDGAREG